MKRTISLLLALMLCLVLFAGCGAQTPAPATEPPADETPADSGEYADYPDHDIEIVITVGATGDTALNVQVLFPLVEKELGVKTITNAMPGAASSVGLLYAKDQKPDGYSMAFSNTNHSLIRAMGYADLDYTDFEVVCSCYTECIDVFIRGDEDRFTDIKSLVEYGKAHPGELTVGSAVVGGCFYFGAYDFLQKTGIDATLIGSDEGSAGLALALLNGDLDVVITSMGTLNTYVKSGEINMIAVAAPERQSAYPDVPTVIECGYDVVLMSTRGIFMPKGTPQAIKDKVEAAFKTAVESDTYKEYCIDNSAEAYFMTGKDYEAFLADELELISGLVEATGLGKPVA